MRQVNSKLKIASAALVVLTAVVALFAGYSIVSPSMVAYAQSMSTSSSQYSVNMATKPGIGSYLTNATGFTLYTFSRDTQNSGTSACTGGCTAKWPAFYVASLALPSGLSATSFTVITRPDGSKQLAYDGWPLYYFINDMSAGQTNGQGVGNVWYACTVPTPFSSTASSATTSASGSGW
jgi:predicted lipoprotein with Yx(FWY)xxD motif